MGGFLLFGLILRIEVYNDDLGREADGGFGWGAVGRPFADWLYGLINSGGPTTGMAPLGMILAVAILALASTVLAAAFRCRRPLWAALAAAGLFAQPYGLANLSFQFDAPLMAAAQLLAIAAACWGCRDRMAAAPLHGRSLLPQAGLLVLSLGLYQAAFGLYWVVALSTAALRCLKGDPALRLRRQLLALLAASALALLSYRVAVLPLRRLSPYAREHAAAASLQELPEVLLANAGRAFGTAWGDWHATAPGFWTAALLLISLLLALEPLRRPRGLAAALEASGLLLLAWALCLGPQLALAHPVVDARTFMPFGAVISCGVLFCEGAVRRLVAVGALPTVAPRVLLVPLLALVWSLAVTGYSYAHAYAQQRRFEAVLLIQLSDHLDRLPAERWRQLRQLDFIGRLPRSPASAQTIRRFPAFEGMVSALVGNGAFGPMQLRQVSGIDLAYAPPTPERTARALAGQLPTLFESRRFHGMQDGPVLVVVTR